MAILRIEELNGDGAGFRALGAHAMADCLLRVLRYEAFQFSLGALVFEKCRVSSGKRACELPRHWTGSCRHADRRNARLRRINPKEGRGLAVLDTAPKLPLGGDNEVLVERIGVGLDLNPLAAAGNDREYRPPGSVAASEKDHGSMNLASKTAPGASTRPSRVAPIRRRLACNCESGARRSID
jgi:hypothetical protein